MLHKDERLLYPLMRIRLLVAFLQSELQGFNSLTNTLSKPVSLSLILSPNMAALRLGFPLNKLFEVICPVCQMSLFKFFECKIRMILRPDFIQCVSN